MLLAEESLEGLPSDVSSAGEEEDCCEFSATAKILESVGCHATRTTLQLWIGEEVANVGLI
jgi:hypothetical protein